MDPIDPMEQRIAVKQLGREIIEACDPQDLRLFDSTADSFLDDPARALASVRGRDEPTGSGLGLTPDFVHAALVLAKLLIDAVPGVILGEVARDIVDRRNHSRRERNGAAEADPRARGARGRTRHRGKPDIRRLLSVEVSLREDDDPGLQATVILSDVPFEVTVEQAARLLEFVEKLVDRAPGHRSAVAENDGFEDIEGGQDAGHGEGRAAS